MRVKNYAVRCAWKIIRRWGQVGIEPTTSRTQSENHATRPLTRACWEHALAVQKFLCIRAPRIELGTYCVLGSRHNQLDQARRLLYGTYVTKNSCGRKIVTHCGQKNSVHFPLKLEGVEPPTFGSGIRRAANCAIASHQKILQRFLVRESNPGRQGENLVSWPSRLTRKITWLKGCDRDRTGDHRICNPMLYHWATHPWLYDARVWREKNISCINTDGIRTRNRWIRSPTRYPIAPQCHLNWLWRCGWQYQYASRTNFIHA